MKNDEVWMTLAAAKECLLDAKACSEAELFYSKINDYLLVNY